MRVFFFEEFVCGSKRDREKQTLKKVLGAYDISDEVCKGWKLLGLNEYEDTLDQKLSKKKIQKKSIS